MSQAEIRSFPPDVAEKIKTYVYRLIDPRNGETFYVGRGIGDRIFSHIRGERNLEGDDIDNKMKRIREIIIAGLEVGHVIHRHGMNGDTASEVEAALIEAYSGLSNLVAGAGSNDRGVMHAKEIISRYSAEPADFRHKLVLINVNRSATESSLYEATRYAWKINKTMAKQAEFVLPTKLGLIVGAFIAHEWIEATTLNFPGRDNWPGRFGFVGMEAPYEIKALYVGKRVPDEYRPPGASNPIRYSWSRHGK
jgi:uncharacterized protein